MTNIVWLQPYRLILLYFVNENSFKQSNSWAAAHLHSNTEAFLYEGTVFLNKSSESMIQLPIHKDSHVLCFWMNQLFKRIKWMNDSVIKSVTCRHLLAVLVKFLKYMFLLFKSFNISILKNKYKNKNFWASLIVWKYTYKALVCSSSRPTSVIYIYIF